MGSLRLSYTQIQDSGNNVEELDLENNVKEIGNDAVQLNESHLRKKVVGNK